MDIEWVAYCIECGELDKGTNGDLIEATAKVHKRKDLHHTVILGTYITEEDAVLSTK